MILHDTVSPLDPIIEMPLALRYALMNIGLCNRVSTLASDDDADMFCATEKYADCLVTPPLGESTVGTRVE